MAADVFETHSGQAQVAKDGTVTLTRSFRVRLDDPALRPSWGFGAIAINKYDAHPDDATCLAVEVTCTPVADELGWFDVSYTYSNRPFDSGSGDSEANGGEPGQNDPTVQPDPTLRTPVVRWSSNTRMVPFTKDWSVPRKAVENSARQPFEGLTVETCTTVVNVTFNLGPLCNIATKQQTFVNKVNNAGFKIVPKHANYAAGTVRCNAWNGTLQFEAGYGWYVGCEVELEYKSDGWDMEVLDMGMYERKFTSSGYVNQKIVDTTTGLPADAPVKLNGAGQKLADGAADVYLTFRPYEWVNFATIFNFV